jgi:hypothetical protein
MTVSKIARATQQVFGVNLTASGNIAQFGSLAANAIAYSLDPAVIQALNAWGNGWAGALVNNQAPALQDMNALFYLITRQLAYSMQTGVPEWDASTSYFIGSIVQDGYGNTYRSLTDNNLNNVVTNSTYWGMTGGQVPVGAVLPIVYGYADYTSGAWTPPSTGVVKDGYMICDGAAIPGSNKMAGKTPILNDGRFLMGVGKAGVGLPATGDIGGSNATRSYAHTHGISPSLGSGYSVSVSGSTTLPNHTHALNANGGAAICMNTVGGDTYFYWKGAGVDIAYDFVSVNAHSAYVVDHSVRTGAALFGNTSSANSAPSIGFTSTGTVTGDLSHSHSTNSQSSSTVDILPQYMAAIYVIRVN